ncbi:20893_t:CDS:2, partial [Racocetra persica]
LENIYGLFGDELVDAERKLDTVDFEDFHKSLCAGVEGRENGPEFAHAFLSVFFKKNSFKVPTLKEISYIKLLEEDLSNG